MKKSILHVGNFLSESGYSRQYIEDLADHLEYAGWIVNRTSSFVLRPLRLIDIATKIMRMHNQFDVGHIAVFSGKAFIWAEAAARVMLGIRKPYILSLHGGNLPAFARQWPRRMRRLLNSADIVVCPSGYLMETMKPYRDDILLLPNAINIESYKFRLRKEAAPKIIWLRSFHAIYNPDLAPEVISLLIKDFPGISLIMVGPDKGDRSLHHTRKKASELGVKEQIVFPGRVDKAEVPIWMNKGDIFINTSEIDNTPISILEAMACGLCVVSTNVGGIPYLVDHEKDALLVSPHDSEAMAYSIRRILTDPDLSQFLSSNARKKAEHFDWSVILPQWELLCNELILEKERA